MNIEKTKSKITVTVDGKSLKYDRNEWSDVENHLTSSGVEKFEEWKIDLIKNHGVDVDELRD